MSEFQLLAEKKYYYCHSQVVGDTAIWHHLDPTQKGEFVISLWVLEFLIPDVFDSNQKLEFELS